MEPIDLRPEADIRQQVATRPPVETRLRVRYAETDQMGVVYYANYLVWMEVWRAAGIRYRDMETSDGILLVVAETNCRHGAPARYDDEIRIQTWIGRATPRMIRFEYEFFDVTTGNLLATGFTKHVFCGPDLRPRKLPEKYWPLFGIAAARGESDS